MVIRWRVSRTISFSTVSLKLVMVIMINLYQDGNFHADLPISGRDFFDDLCTYLNFLMTYDMAMTKTTYLRTRIFMMTYLSQDENAG